MNVPKPLPAAAKKTTLKEEDDAEGSALLKRGLLTGDGGELAS